MGQKWAFLAFSASMGGGPVGPLPALITPNSLNWGRFFTVPIGQEPGGSVARLFRAIGSPRALGGPGIRKCGLY